MPAAERWRPPLLVRLSAGLHGTAAGLLLVHPGWWAGLAGAVAANHAVLAAVGIHPNSTWLGPVTHRLPDGAAAVALTFDDGPDPRTTPAVLDILAAAGAQASFFCIGARAARHPALVRRIVAEGHVVENHTMTHPAHFALLGPAGMAREIAAAQDVLAGLAGVAPRWFRAPVGIRSPILGPVLQQAGLGLAGWTRRGYDTRCADPVVVLRRLQRRLRPADMLLLHDGNAARGPDGPVVLGVLPALLAVLAGRGLRACALTPPGARAAAAGGAGTPASAGYA